MSKWIVNKSKVGKVIYQSQNIVVVEEQKGINTRRCFLIGIGNSITLDDKQRIKKHDPFMPRFNSGISKGNTVYVFYFANSCTGLVDAAEDVAKFVNKLSLYKEVVLVGHSKCGVCLTHATSLCNNPKQIILVTISTPFKGTCLADGEAMRLCLKKWYLKVPYSLIFSNHPVDKDIAPESSFITKLKPPLCKKHINIVTTLDCNSQCNSIVDRILLWWNKQADLGRCDGFVPLESQKTSCDQQFIVPGSHAQSIDFVQKIEELLYINQ